jgi:hypothetical protein
MLHRNLVRNYCTARDRKTKAPLALLAQAEPQGLRYAGSAFITLSGIERAELSARLQMSKLERCPIPKLHFPDAQWVNPQLMARVRHLAGSKYLRHGTVRAIDYHHQLKPTVALCQLNKHVHYRHSPKATIAKRRASRARTRPRRSLTAQVPGLLRFCRWRDPLKPQGDPQFAISPGTHRGYGLHRPGDLQTLAGEFILAFTEGSGVLCACKTSIQMKGFASMLPSQL